MKETSDILTLFEALNNHEVFTPPRLAREMLDHLPNETWSNPDLKLLDPCTKSGVFLREAFYKFYDGLKDKGEYIGADGKVYDLSEHKQRINHILKNMLFGIATSELTGYVARRTLYGVMEANTDKQIAAIDSFERSTNFHEWTEEERLNFIGRNKFNEYYDHTMFNTEEYKGFEHEGNIFYPVDEVAKKVLEDGSYEVEDTYFPFIDEATKHRKIIDIKEGKMKFDVIIGNPPYQISDGGSGSGMSAKPIYHLFVNQAKSMSPKYLSMIMPSRWFSGGKGLDKFRNDMLNDKRISHIVDFENSNEVFPGVDVAGGISYFLWDKNHKTDCEITNKIKNESFSSIRPLNEFHILVRHSKSLSIIHKIQNIEKGAYLDKVVSARKPFGIPSNYKPKSSGTPCWFTQKLGKQFVQTELVRDENKYKDKWKVLIPFAPIAGQTDFSKPIKFYHSQNVKIAKPGEVCTETYLVAHAFDSEQEALNFKGYLFTKIFRFLLLQNVISQNITRGCFYFVPELDDYKKQITDDELKNRWGITNDEWEFISQKIQDTE